MKTFIKGEREQRRNSSWTTHLCEALTFALISLVIGCHHRAKPVPVFDHTRPVTATPQSGTSTAIPQSPARDRDGRSAVTITQLETLEAELKRIDVSQLNCTNPNTVEAAKRCDTYAQLAAQIAKLKLKLNLKLNP